MGTEGNFSIGNKFMCFSTAVTDHVPPGSLTSSSLGSLNSILIAEWREPVLGALVHLATVFCLDPVMMLLTAEMKTLNLGGERGDCPSLVLVHKGLRTSGFVIRTF